jgi:hypothetical protein
MPKGDAVAIVEVMLRKSERRKGRGSILIFLLL